MNRYTVKLTVDSENAFASIIRFDHDAVIELEDADKNIYSIETRHNIERLLDAEAGVVTYDVLEVNA